MSITNYMDTGHDILYSIIAIVFSVERVYIPYSLDSLSAEIIYFILNSLYTLYEMQMQNKMKLSAEKKARQHLSVRLIL